MEGLYCGRGAAVGLSCASLQDVWVLGERSLNGYAEGPVEGSSQSHRQVRVAAQ